jgi:hypothetical protein
MIIRRLRRIVRRIGGKILYFLSFFDHITARSNSKIHFPKEIDVDLNPNICVFVTYGESRLSSTSASLIKELDDFGFKVIHINNSKELRNSEFLGNLSSFLRSNYGYDLAAVRDAFRLFNELPKSILILNSSVQYLPGGLEKMLFSSRMLDCDVIGATESFQNRSHFQSYFFYSQTELGIRSLSQEYERMRNWRSKRASVSFGELRIVENLKRRNVRVGSLIPYQSAVEAALQNTSLIDDSVLEDLKRGVALNPSQHLWQVLLYLDLPIVKNVLLKYNPAKLKNAPKSITEVISTYQSFRRN